jgi:hypothetical protein
VTTWADRASLAASWPCVDGIDPAEPIKFARVTPEGGFACAFCAGEALVAGNIVQVDGAADESVVKASDTSSFLGIVYADAASGDVVWVVVYGRCSVLMKDSTAVTRSDKLFISATDGRADNTSAVLVGFALESNAGGTDQLVKCVVHF